MVKNLSKLPEEQVGHSAAFATTNGAVRWRSSTAAFADDIAAGDGVVWTTDGGTLVAQRSSTGQRLARFRTSSTGGIVNIAASGTSVVTLANGTRHDVLRSYATSGAGPRHTTAVASSSFCHTAAGGGDLYALCIGGAENWTLYRLDDATGKTLAKRRLPSGTDGGQDVVYADGHVYTLEATGPGGSNTTPAKVVQMNAATLAPETSSPALDITAMAVAGTAVAGLEVSAHGVPVGVAVLGASTLTLRHTAPVHATSTVTVPLFAADASTAVVVVNPATTKQVAEHLIGIPLTS